MAKRLGFDSVHFEHATGFSGGIWVSWNSVIIVVHILLSTKQVVYFYTSPSVAAHRH